MRESECLRLLSLLSSTFAAANPHGAGNMPEETRVRYYELLHDLDFEETKAAIDDLCRHNRFIPVPAEIRDAVLARKTMLEEPEIAWGQVMLQIRKCGRDRRPVFFNPAIEAAVVMLGWRVLCDADERSMAAHYAHFRDMYRVCVKRITFAVESGMIRPGTAGAREDALKAAGVQSEAVFIAPGEDPKLPPGVAELRTVVGRVLVRIDTEPKERTK